MFMRLRRLSTMQCSENALGHIHEAHEEAIVWISPNFKLELCPEPVFHWARLRILSSITGLNISWQKRRKLKNAMLV